MILMMNDSWGKGGRWNKENAISRFLAKTKRVGACLIWTASRNGGHRPGRYGSTAYRGKHMLSHRLSYILFKGEIPEGAYICHTCDNGLCVEPSHLFAGTQTDNMRDMEAKGRSFHPNCEKHGRAKITNEDADKIRTLHKAGHSIRSLADLYSLSRPSISRIVKGKGWLTTSYLEGQTSHQHHSDQP
jgi:hypothetical protein